MRFWGGATSDTISQFTMNSATRIPMNFRGLQGIIGGFFFGAPLTRRLPRSGSGGGGGVRGSGGRLSSAMRPLYGRWPRNFSSAPMLSRQGASSDSSPNIVQGH